MAVVEPSGAVRGRITEEEFMRLPGDGRKWELVNGEAREVPTSFEHDTIAMGLALRLGPHVKGRGYLTGAQAGFRMANGNIRCPDLAFTLKSRLPGGKPPRAFLGAAPDLAVEIISPSEAKDDAAQKVQDYFASGSQEVWQILPETQQLRRYLSAQGSVLLEAADELDGGALLPGFRCRVGELFELE